MKKSSQISIEQFAEEELKRLEEKRQQAINAPFADLYWSPTHYPTRGYRSDIRRISVVTAKGGYPYLGSLPVGESQIRLLREIPKDDVDQNSNPRKQFLARKNVGSSTSPQEGAEVLAWTVNPRSPLYRDLIQHLPKAPLWLRVIRTGESKSDTRWSVKAF